MFTAIMINLNISQYFEVFCSRTCNNSNFILYHLKVLWQVYAMKSSQADCHIKDEI
jgi:hypothetical protein